MKIVVTGATGFIGAAVVAELAARGHEVYALLRPTSDPIRLKRVAGWRGIRAESWDSFDIVEALAAHRPEAFVHCAWQGVGRAERNASWQMTANLRLTASMLELAKKIGCTHWLSLGSQAEYGNLNQRIREDSPTNPTTLYGKAKLIATEASQAFCEAEGMKAAILRVFSTYGPGDAPEWFIPHNIRELMAGRAPKLTACEQRWDYLYVGDAARAIACSVEAQLTGVFNLGSGVARPLRDIVEVIRAELGTTIVPAFGSIPYRPDQVMWLEADITRLGHATGWRPSVSLEAGIKATVAFAQTNHNQV